ncbi:Protein Mut11 [Apostasia shenzhenica]|uniref:Protein Mut11 n=1 Tax=Apostasia shenzhenica TaxID=1088818 RepID=A0A2I0AHN4_9ASPA|nr:Protein Mut11 [Apostasia shenzhenica]
MENMQHAEELVKEFLVFRGFTNTLQVFERELSTDVGRNFQVDKITDLVFSVYIPKFQADKLVGLLNFFKQSFSSASDVVLLSTLSKLELSILRYYIVNALQTGRQDKAVEFFAVNGNYLLQKREEWLPWFAIPYLKNPSLDQQFRVYFSKDWFDALQLSLHNFLSEIFNGTRIPVLLRISIEKNTVKRLKTDIKQLNQKLLQLQALLETKETEILNLRAEIKQEILREEEFPEVTVDFQETFLGHSSPISRCRFSSSGTNVASASLDGTVRIWTYDSATLASRNATIYCGGEIMSLEWERRSDRLLLIGTADGGIKAWNVDAKRVVCDLSTTQEFPSVVDLKCSPVEPIFVSAAASRRQGSSKIDRLGFASLTVWNMKTWKAVTALPLGKDPPAVTSLSFNHNGKILAASATDGMIHMFDLSAGLQITGWPAHDSAVSSVLFGPDETSIFSLGTDGKIFEWSLHNQGKVIWSRDCSRYCYPESDNICRHEIALDSNGRRLLVTSGSVRSPIYQVQSHTSALKTLPHTAAITSVDWHPTLPTFITGSADHSVRVTSIMQ